MHQIYSTIESPGEGLYSNNFHSLAYVLKSKLRRVGVYNPTVFYFALHIIQIYAFLLHLVFLKVEFHFSFFSMEAAHTVMLIILSMVVFVLI